MTVVPIATNCTLATFASPVWAMAVTLTNGCASSLPSLIEQVLVWTFNLFKLTWVWETLGSFLVTRVFVSFTARIFLVNWS